MFTIPETFDALDRMFQKHTNPIGGIAICRVEHVNEASALIWPHLSEYAAENHYVGTTPKETHKIHEKYQKDKNHSERKLFRKMLAEIGIPRGTYNDWYTAVFGIYPTSEIYDDGSPEEIIAIVLAPKRTPKGPEELP